MQRIRTSMCHSISQTENSYLMMCLDLTEQLQDPTNMAGKHYRYDTQFIIQQKNYYQEIICLFLIKKKKLNDQKRNYLFQLKKKKQFIISSGPSGKTVIVYNGRKHLFVYLHFLIKKYTQIKRKKNIRKNVCMSLQSTLK